MDAITELLDQAKTRKGLVTDTALADALGVSRGTVSGWRHGARLPDTVACGRLAVLTGVPLGRVLGIVGEAREVSKDAKAVWRKLASAAALLLLVGAGALPSPAAAQTLDSTSVSAPMYIMSILKRWLAGLMPARSTLTALPA